MWNALRYILFSFTPLCLLARSANDLGKACPLSKKKTRIVLCRVIVVSFVFVRRVQKLHNTKRIFSFYIKNVSQWTETKISSRERNSVLIRIRLITFELLATTCCHGKINRFGFRKKVIENIFSCFVKKYGDFNCVCVCVFHFIR